MSAPPPGDARKVVARNRKARHEYEVLDSWEAGLVLKGTEVRLVGFGTFSVARRKASEGRNPRTGEKIDIPESNQAKFKAGKGLKDALN